MSTKRNWLVCLTSIVAIFSLMFFANPSGRSFARSASEAVLPMNKKSPSLQDPAGGEQNAWQEDDQDEDDQDDDGRDRRERQDGEDRGDGDWDEEENDWDEEEDWDQEGSDRWQDEDEEGEDEEDEEEWEQEDEEYEGDGWDDQEEGDENDWEFDFEYELAGLELERSSIEYNIGRLEVIARLKAIAEDSSSVKAYAIMHVSDLTDADEAINLLEEVRQNGNNSTVRRLAMMKLAELYAQEDRVDDVRAIFRELLEISEKISD